MNVGDIISRSQLLQKIENTQASASADERSSKPVMKLKESYSGSYV